MTRSLNILIVDDSATTRGLIRKTLRLSEIPTDRLWEVGNGQEALALLSANRVDLMLTDLNMPVLGGRELIRLMGERGLLEGIAIVVVTTVGSDAVRAELLAAGARAFLRKPFTPERLRDVIHEILEVDDGS